MPLFRAPGEPIVTKLWVDSGTTLGISQQNGSVDHPYATVQQAIDHGAASLLSTAWEINVAFGSYPDPIAVPPNKVFIIKGAIRAPGNMTIGPVIWTVTGFFTSSLGFRDVVVQQVTVLDDTIPAINAILVWENSQCNGISATGSSFITVSIGGATLASFSSISTPVVAAVVAGDIDIANGHLLAHNVQFQPTCTLVRSGSVLFYGSSVNQNIECSGTDVELGATVWNGPYTIEFTGSAGTLLVDEASSASFIESGSSVINGNITISSNRSTGWLSGGEVTRDTGLDIDVALGSGFVFLTDSSTAFVRWDATNISLPPNQLRDIVVDQDGVVSSVVHPVDNKNFIILSTAYTNSSDVIILTPSYAESKQLLPQISSYLSSVIGPVHISGIGVTEYSAPSLNLQVDAGYYYNSLKLHNATASVPITFTAWYRDGLGGFITISGQTDVDSGFYDDSDGALGILPSGKYKKDLLFLSVSELGPEYHLIYAQEYYDSQSAAEAGNLPVPPESLTITAIKLAGIVTLSGDTEITSITDERPRLGQLASGSTSVSDHGLLTGLSDNDHPQYQLQSQKNAANGYAGLNGSTKLSGSQQTYGTIANTAVEGNDTRVPTQAENDALVGTNGAPGSLNPYVTDSDPRNTNARTPTAHVVTHQPGGTDPLVVAAPVTIGSANVEGVATSLSRSDHIHAHGSQGGGSEHALVTILVPGFMSDTDKVKLNGVSPLAAALTSTPPVDVTKSAAVVGAGTTAARHDHKHDVTTAIAGSIIIADTATEGVATSLSRSDHRHDLSAPGAPVNVTKAVASAGTSGNVAREDHKHDVTTAIAGGLAIGDASAEGVATSLSRSDHIHAFPAPAAPVDVTKAVASAGVSANAARADHKHDVTTAAPVTISSANAEGSSTSLARADHVHNHGAQGGGTQHADVVSGGASGFISGASQLKLDGLQNSFVVFGNTGVAGTTTTRYLTPGYTDGTALTTPVQFRVPGPGTFKKLRVRHNTTAGNGNVIVYTLRINGVASALTVSLASTSNDGSDLTNTVAVVAGDLVDIEVTKAASIATSPSNITATMEFTF